MKIDVHESKVDGSGVFAKKDIKKGEIIALIKGTPIKHFVVDKKTSEAGPNWIGVGENLWIDPSPPFHNLNHSCDPNAGIRGSKTIVALQNIKKGEEVLIDYSTTEIDVLWKLDKKCKCGSKNCRGTIKSIQSLPKHTFNKYMPNIPHFFQKVYMKHHSIRNSYLNKWKKNQKNS